MAEQVIPGLPTQRQVSAGFPIVIHQLPNPTSVHEDVGLIPSLDQWIKDLALPWAVVSVADVAQIPLIVAVA